MSVRLTTGQAIVRFLQHQHVEFDGSTERFFAGCWGIFGHGNIGGIAQGLQQAGTDFPYYLARNEQSMVHTAIGFAKLANRRRAFACLTSIGPGSTNMITGAAAATINRVPVLLMSGDTFAERVQDPVLQQLVSEHAGDLTVSDAFRPVVRYFDRITRPGADHRFSPGGDAHAHVSRRHRCGVPVGATGRADVRLRLPRRVVRAAHLGDRPPTGRRHAVGSGPLSGSVPPSVR